MSCKKAEKEMRKINRNKKKEKSKMRFEGQK